MAPSLQVSLYAWRRSRAPSGRSRPPNKSLHLTMGVGRFDVDCSNPWHKIKELFRKNATDTMFPLGGR